MWTCDRAGRAAPLSSSRGCSPGVRPRRSPRNRRGRQTPAASGRECPGSRRGCGRTRAPRAGCSATARRSADARPPAFVRRFRVIPESARTKPALAAINRACSPRAPSARSPLSAPSPHSPIVRELARVLQFVRNLSRTPSKQAESPEIEPKTRFQSAAAPTGTSLHGPARADAATHPLRNLPAQPTQWLSFQPVRTPQSPIAPLPHDPPPRRRR